MSAATRTARHGITIIELMVCVLILGLLAVAAVANLNDTAESRRFREAARNVSSFVARAQSRAIAASTQRGLLLQPLPADPAAAIDLFFADVPDAYCGEAIDSRVAIGPPPVTTAIVPPPNSPPPQLQLQFDEGTESRLRRDPGFVQTGDSIRFGAGSVGYPLVVPAGAGSFQVGMWSEDSQTIANTAWPRALPPGTTFRIERQPKRASSGVLQMQRGTAIDLAWSCVGTRPLAAPGFPPIITDLTKPVTLLFDSSGRPSQLVHSGGKRTILGEPLFLLLGASENAGDPYRTLTGNQDPAAAAEAGGANWQFSNRIWLCIDGNTGVVKFAPVAPDATTVFASQRYVRLTVGLGAVER